MMVIPLKRFWQSDFGVSAVEFALILPVMLTIMFGGYVLMQCVAIHRKVTITTRALADLTTEYSSLNATQMNAIINASAQIMAPFDTAPLQIRLSEIQTIGQSPCNFSNPSAALVTWSVPVGYQKYNQCSTYPLPAGMFLVNTSYIVSEVSYIYTPVVGYKFLGPFTISDHLVMLPRTSQNIPYTGP